MSKLEEKLKISKAEAENAKRDLKNEREGRAIIDKKIKSKYVVHVQSLGIKHACVGVRWREFLYKVK